MRKKSVLKIVIALLAVMNLVVYITGIVAYFDIVEIPFLDSILGHFQTEDVDEENELEAEAPLENQDDEKTLTEDENDSKQPVSEEWKQAYLDLMKKPGGDNVKYKLVYIDDDDIPELYILGNTVAQGDMLCTYREGEVWGMHMYNYGLSYLERQNSFCDSGGRMDSYFDYVYSLEDEGAIMWHKGEFGAGGTRVQYDKEGNFIYEYRWDGTMVSEKEYETNLKKVYDESKAKLGYEGACSRDEMREIIERMGMSSSVMEDVKKSENSAEKESGVDGNYAAERVVASGECGENVTWSLTDGGTMTISGSGDMRDYGYDFSGESAFVGAFAEKIKTIVVEDGVTSIGSGAFFACENLTEIKMSDGITKIGDFAFVGCDSLTEVRLPEKLYYVGNYAFGECASLETVYFRGDAPEFNVDEEQFDIGTDRKSTFAWDTVTIYYPANNPTWTEEKLQDEYGGWLTWQPWKL